MGSVSTQYILTWIKVSVTVIAHEYLLEILILTLHRTADDSCHQLLFNEEEEDDNGQYCQESRSGEKHPLCGVPTHEIVEAQCEGGLVDRLDECECEHELVP